MKPLPDPHKINLRRAQAYIGSMHGEIEPLITRFKAVNRYAQWLERKSRWDEDQKKLRQFVLAFRHKHGLRTIAAEENGQMQALKPATTAD